MKTSSLSFTVALAVLTAVQLLITVQPGSAEEKEKAVAFRMTGGTFDGKYVSTNPPDELNGTGTRIGSKQTFRLIDVNGAELADGDEIRIQYIPNAQGKPDPSKASFWKEAPEGIKRAREGDVFKVKPVDKKYLFVAPSGQFVGAPIDGGRLAVTNAQEGAMLLEIADLQPKAPNKPEAEKPASKKPATE